MTRAQQLLTCTLVAFGLAAGSACILNPKPLPPEESTAAGDQTDAAGQKFDASPISIDEAGPPIADSGAFVDVDAGLPLSPCDPDAGDAGRVDAGYACAPDAGAADAGPVDSGAADAR